MRLEQTFNLVKLYLIFFIRKVLNFGFLKNIIFRVLFSVALLGFIGLMTKLIYSFLVKNSNFELNSFFLDIYTLNIIMWTFIIFLIMKMLFMRANELMKITIPFPITQKERNASVIVFELIVTTMLVFLVSFSIVLAFFLKYQWQFLPKIINNIFFISLTCYLLLNIAYLSFNRLLNIFNLMKIKDIYNNLFVILLFVFYYNHYMEIFRKFNTDYTSGNYERNSVILIWSMLTDKIGFVFTSAIFLVFFIICLGLLMLIADNSYIVMKKFLNISYFNSKTVTFTYFKLYCLNLIRRADYLNTVAISYIIFGFLLYFKQENAVYTTVVVSLNGIYFYVQTMNIRNLQKKLKYNSVFDYQQLITSQFVSNVFTSLPVFIVYYLVWQNISNILYACLALLVSIIMFTFTGIIFPPKNENPFSVVISFIIIITTIIFTVLVMSPLQLSLLMTVIIFSVIIAGVIMMSIYGLIKLQGEDYHAKNI